MTRILSSDLLIADAIVPFTDPQKLHSLIEAYGLAPGGKSALNRGQFEALTQALESEAMTIAPGGSSANVLVTLAKLGKDVQVQFIGALGEGMSSQMVRGSLEEAGIALTPAAAVSQIAVSYVMVCANGQRTVATYPGNARDIVKAGLVTDDMVKNADALLVVGSLWQRFDTGFADKLVSLRWQYDKQLWLCLPTHVQFNKNQAALFHRLIGRANLVLSNEEELARIYDAPFEEALARLQSAFAEENLSKAGKRQLQPQAAFITRGEKGVAVVTREHIDSVDAPAVVPGEIVNTLGAGDTAFAGFIFGYLKGLPLADCAQLAMALAAKKLRVNAARLPDPRASLPQKYL